MNLQDIRTLYDYDAWANRRVLEVCSRLNPEQFTGNTSSSFPSIRDTLVHIMGAQKIWLDRWQGSSPSALLPAVDFQTAATIADRWQGIEKQLLQYIGSLSETDLGKNLQYKNLAGQPLSQPLWQTMQHLANHGTYHRGQITTFLRQLGATPVSTDMIIFYRDRAAS